MYLGLDIGTSSVKGVLTDTRQKILAAASSPLMVSRPRPGWSEQKPEDWWKAVNAVVRALAKAKPKAVAAVEGIGLSGQQHGATLLDRADKVLRPAILWNDARSFAECKEIEAREPKARQIAGNIALAGFTAPKLVWVRKHEPDIFAKVAKVLLPKDYVRLRMTGDYASDMSDSAGTFWLDVEKRQWWTGCWRQAAAPRPDAKLHGAPKPREFGRRGRQAWGMAKRPVVAGGGGDNAASACSIGAVTPARSHIARRRAFFSFQRPVRPIPRARCMPSATRCPAPGTRWASSSRPRRASNGWRTCSGHRRQNSRQRSATRSTARLRFCSCPICRASGRRWPMRKRAACSWGWGTRRTRRY
jgi:xylulokinase